MDNDNNNNEGLTDSISAAVQSLVQEHCGDVINAETEHSINADMLNEILNKVRMKLHGLEYNNELQTKISECRALLNQIFGFNANACDDLYYIRELLNNVQDEVGESSENSNELDDDHGDQIQDEDDGFDEHKECNE